MCKDILWVEVIKVVESRFIIDWGVGGFYVMSNVIEFKLKC